MQSEQCSQRALNNLCSRVSPSKVLVISILASLLQWVFGQEWACKARPSLRRVVFAVVTVTQSPCLRNLKVIRQREVNLYQRGWTYLRAQAYITTASSYLLFYYLNPCCNAIVRWCGVPRSRAAVIGCQQH